MTQCYEEAFFCIDENGAEIGIDRGKLEFAMTAMAYNKYWESWEIEQVNDQLEKLWVDFANSPYYSLDQSYLQCCHDFFQSKIY